MKAGQTITSDYFSGLQYWLQLSAQTKQAWLVYAGKQQQKRHHIDIIGWQDLGRITIQNKFLYKSKHYKMRWIKRKIHTLSY